MKIKMLVGFEGPSISVSPGQITEAFTDSDARSLIAAGYAEPVAPVKVEKSAKSPAPEKR